MRFVLALLLVSIALAACQSTDSTSTPTPVQWQRVVTQSLAPEPGFALNIPGDWTYEASEKGIIIYNRPGLLERQEHYADMPAGAMVLSLTLLSAADARRIATDAAGILDAFVGRSSGDRRQPAYASVELVEVRGRDLAQLSVSIGESESLLLAMALQRNFLLAIAVAPKGELERQRGLLSQIFDSIELRAAG